MDFPPICYYGDIVGKVNHLIKQKLINIRYDHSYKCHIIDTNLLPHELQGREQEERWFLLDFHQKSEKKQSKSIVSDWSNSNDQW